MTRVTLEQPKIEGQTASFSWRVEPATPLYHRNSFSVQFPASVDISRVAPQFWWTFLLACLHSHWPLLRPCRVVLPVRLPGNAIATWARLLEAEGNTLDAYRADRRRLPPVELVETGELLEPLEKIEDDAGCASAFSGGKDSLLSAAMLCDFGLRPVLVTTTSVMAAKNDHSTARRRHVLAQIAARRDVLHVEVESDFRSCYDNNFASAAGYSTAVNEISDTLLYFAALLAVAMALRLPHLFLASEAEVQENAERDGVVIQHRHYMYSTVTQRALEALLAPTGIHFSSLTSPLHNGQVQQLLWRRYHDLSGLQYSCWRIRSDEVTCSSCIDCFRMALCTLFVGGNPQRMGIDLVKLLTAMRDWQPRIFAERAPESLTPNERLRPENDRQIVQYLQRVPLRRILHLVAGRGARPPIAPPVRSALKSYAQLRRRLADFPAGEPLGYRPGFLRQVDPLLRDKVADVYARYFEPEPQSDYEDLLRRGDALVEWICEPLEYAARN